MSVPPVSPSASSSVALSMLLERYHEDRSPALLEEIVARQMHLVRQVTRRFADRGESLEDLQQVAALGLVKAVQSYNPTLGHQFSTYAIPTMLGEIKRWFRDKGWAVRVPRRLQELGQAVRRSQEALSHTLGRVPTTHEIANALHVTSEQVSEALESTQHYRALSIDAMQNPSGEEGDERTPLSIGHDDPAMRNADLRVILERACDRLPQREREIVRLRFVEGLSQAQVARRLSLSQMHISRLQKRALTTLREAIEPKEPPLPAGALATTARVRG